MQEVRGGQRNPSKFRVPLVGSVRKFGFMLLKVNQDRKFLR